jgi:hypothetical protein
MSELPPVPQRGKDILTWAKRLQSTLKSIIPRSSATIKVNRTVGGTTFEVSRLSATDPYPFEIILGETSETIAVRGGRWDNTTLGATVTSWGVDGPTDGSLSVTAGPIYDQDSQTDDFAIADGTTRYLYARLYDPTPIKGSITNPTTMGVWASASRTLEQTGGEQAGSYKYLGAVSNSGGSITITQEWFGGNIKTTINQFDSADPIPATTLRSLSYNSNNSAEVYGFEAASAYETPRKVGNDIDWEILNIGNATTSLTADAGATRLLGGGRPAGPA